MRAEHSKIALVERVGRIYRKCLTRIKRGQKPYQSRGLRLRMCRQGLFYIFNQAPFLNLQKIIQRHVIGLFYKMGTKHWFLPPGTSMPGMLMQYTPAQCTAMPCMAMSCKPCHASYVMHGHVKHVNAVHWMFYVRINRDMPTVAIGQKPV